MNIGVSAGVELRGKTSLYRMLAKVDFSVAFYTTFHEGQSTEKLRSLEPFLSVIGRSIVAENACYVRLRGVCSEWDFDDSILLIG